MNAAAVEGRASTASRAYENLLVGVLALGGAVAALDAQSLYYLGPFVATSLQLNNALLGIVSSVVLLSWSVAGYVVGAISDRTGRHKPWLVGTFLMFAACSFLSGLAGSFATLFAARLLIGLAEGPVIPVSQSIMLSNSSPHRRGLNMGIVQNLGAQLVGAFLAPIALVKIANAYSWHAAFYVAGIPALIVAALIALVVKEKPHVSTDKQLSTEVVDVGILHLLRVPNVKICVLIACCVVAWYFVLLTFLPLYCVRILKISSTDMSYVMSAMGAAGVVSALVVPAASDWLGRKLAIFIVTVLAIVTPLAPMYLDHSLPALIAIVFAGSMVLGSIPVFMATVPVESVPARDAASATGLVMGLGQIVGGLCGPMIGGLLADRWGLKMPLWIAVGATIVAALLSLRLRETAPRKLHSA